MRAWERRKGRTEWARPGGGSARGTPAEPRPAETRGASEGDEERGGKEGLGRQAAADQDQVRPRVVGPWRQTATPPRALGDEQGGWRRLGSWRGHNPLLRHSRERPSHAAGRDGAAHRGKHLGSLTRGRLRRPGLQISKGLVLVHRAPQRHSSTSRA